MNNCRIFRTGAEYMKRRGCIRGIVRVLLNPDMVATDNGMPTTGMKYDSFTVMADYASGSLANMISLASFGSFDEYMNWNLLTSINRSPATKIPLSLGVG